MYAHAQHLHKVGINVTIIFVELLFHFIASIKFKMASFYNKMGKQNPKFEKVIF